LYVDLVIILSLVCVGISMLVDSAEEPL
jgi:hypothetical protein